MSTFDTQNELNFLKDIVFTNIKKFEFEPNTYTSRLAIKYNILQDLTSIFPTRYMPDIIVNPDNFDNVMFKIHWGNKIYEVVRN
jgi:hypothetical protein